MNKQQESEKAWREFTQKRFDEIINGTNGAIKGSFQLTAISDFKLALIKEIKEERDYCKSLLDEGFNDDDAEARCYGKYVFCNELINRIINEVKPLEP